MLLARAKAAGQLGGGIMQSAADLFGSDSEPERNEAQHPPRSTPSRGSGSGTPPNAADLLSSGDDRSPRSRVGQAGGAGGGTTLNAADLLSSGDDRSPRSRVGLAGGAGRGLTLNAADLFDSDDDKEPASSHRVVPLPSAPRDYRSTHANVRDDDARLHWPPSAIDYKLDALQGDSGEPEGEPDGGRRERGWSRPRRRGFAPDAKTLFDDELERQLTDLVLLLTLEGESCATERFDL